MLGQQVGSYQGTCDGSLESEFLVDGNSAFGALPVGSEQYRVKYSYVAAMGRCNGESVVTARPDRNESGFPRHAGGASLTH
jgi:hypothetical protein